MPKSAPAPTLVVDKSPSAPETSEFTPPSPKTLRNRDLAKALFGKEGHDEIPVPSEVNLPEKSPQLPKSPTPSAPLQEYLLSPPPNPPYQTARNPSMPKIPQSPQEEANLTREVQQRIDAATLALNKSPVKPNLPDPYATVSRKRVNPNLISNPRLVSASTSVDTVPIVRTPSLSSSSSPSKIGSRFKKLRGSLRAKNLALASEEAAAYPVPPAVQTAYYDSVKLKVPGVAVPSSATESRYKVPIPSPPASAGPGLKGFMARLRGKQRAVPDNPSQSEFRVSTQPQPTSPAPPPPQPTPTAKSPSLAPSTDAAPNIILSQPESPETQPASSTNTIRGPSSLLPEADDTVLKQLFDAANKMGIDQGELSALLARKGSTSTKSVLTKSDSIVTRRVGTPVSARRQTFDEGSVRAVTPDSKTTERRDDRLSPDLQAPRDRPASRQRKHPEHLRRQREGQSDSRAPSAIIRRTIIFPDSKMSANELSVLMGKSSSGRRRGSVTSASSRSIHDRAPTPPPPRSPTSKRFSNGPSPPVPSLPANLVVPTDGTLEKASSNYDSL